MQLLTSGIGIKIQHKFKYEPEVDFKEVFEGKKYSSRKEGQIRIIPSKKKEMVIDQVLDFKMKDFPQSQKFEFQPQYVQEFQKFWIFNNNYFDFMEEKEGEETFSL